MAVTWKDGTSYRQDDTERVPATWVADVDRLRIVVTRLSGIPDTWFLTCKPWFQHAALEQRDLTKARGEALRRVAEAVNGAASELRAYG